MSSDEVATPPTVTLGTLAGFLNGRRSAIETLIRAPGALWLGFVFVLSAGFAREYDAESLLHEPWYFLIPFPASLVTSFILYGFLYSAAHAKGARGRGFFELYPTFLTLYWMTAPLAWLYAIPVERFLSPVDAAAMNFALLGIVSIWRVALITRAASIMFSAPIGFTFTIVMWFAGTVLVLVALFAPKPIVSIMGGIHLNDTESLVQGVLFMTIFVSSITWFIWLSALIERYLRTPPTLQFPPRPTEPALIGGSAKVIAVASLAVWLGVMPFTQREQSLRYRAERELIHGDLHQGLAMMSAHEQDDFPPHWAPPPRLAYGESKPDLEEVYQAITDESVADWVAELYWLMGEEAFEGYSHRWRYPPREGRRLDQYLTYLEGYPRRDDVLEDLTEDLEEMATTLEESDEPEDEERAKRVRRLLELAPKKADEGNNAE
jgi:hypothetical protein